MARDGIQGMADRWQTYDEAYAMAMAMVPMGRMNTPAEIAGTGRMVGQRQGAGVASSRAGHQWRKLDALTVGSPPETARNLVIAGPVTPCRYDSLVAAQSVLIE